MQWYFGRSELYMGGIPDITLGHIQTNKPLLGKCTGTQRGTY